MLTWNFDINMEISSKQFKKTENQKYCYVVKGMNQKNNYLLTNSYLIDLEYNIPLR